MRHPLPSAAATAELGRRIREQRTALGVPKQALAGLIGVTPPQVWGWETGRKNPSLGSVLLLARSLGVKPGVLLDGLEHL